jgi:hypothetical protein
MNDLILLAFIGVGIIAGQWLAFYLERLIHRRRDANYKPLDITNGIGEINYFKHKDNFYTKN